MRKTRTAASAAIGALLGLGLASTSFAAVEKPKYPHEKCYGVAKKGMNDCGAGAHTCGGKSAADNDPAEWIYVPEGVCKKIVGGSLQASSGN